MTLLHLSGKRNRDVASSVECYIDEYSVTSDVAIARINALIEDEWRTLNQARFGNLALLHAQQRIIGLARSASLIYDNRKDVYTDSMHLQTTIEGLFVKPIQMCTDSNTSPFVSEIIGELISP